MKTILKILLAVFVLSLTPTTYVCAQGHIETPAERKARQEREAAAKKKRQQDAAARQQREEAERKRREAEEQAAREQTAREQAAREQAEREQAAREEAERKRREAEEEERLRPIRELEANMVRVEGGTFQMGGKYITDEKPIHKVTLSSFSICKYEVTQELWQAVMGQNPSEFKGAKRPVENVSWFSCQHFIEKLNQLTGKQYRLPTEAEWEYAARGGNQASLNADNELGYYYYAGSYNIDEVAWYEDNSDKQTHDVGLKKPNELGLYDMTGNVWEWCQDWYGEYKRGHQTDPKGPSGNVKQTHVMRGGCWAFSILYSKVSHRGYSNRQSSRTGFRLAL